MNNLPREYSLNNFFFVVVVLKKKQENVIEILFYFIFLPIMLKTKSN